MERITATARWPFALWIHTLALGLCVLVGEADAGSATQVSTVPLRSLSPLAHSDEVVRRALTPFVRRELLRQLGSRGRLQPHAMGTEGEAVDLYTHVADGDASAWGLLVFVPPSDDFRLPRDWEAVLADSRLIAAVPRNAGNRHHVIGRRLPLVLHAHALASSRHHIDPDRVFVAGLSGGSRVAQAAALAYPDVFRGAVLFAGSDVLGAGLAVPPVELMSRFQRDSRVVFATGGLDEVNVTRDAIARRSLERFCVQNLHVVRLPRLGHALPGRTGFARALSALLQPSVGPSQECRLALRSQIDAALRTASRHADRGDLGAARDALDKLDASFGGLAAPASIELADRLDAID